MSSDSSCPRGCGGLPLAEAIGSIYGTKVTAWRLHLGPVHFAFGLARFSAGPLDTMLLLQYCVDSEGVWG